MSNTLESILARLEGHGPAEARKLLDSQWGFLAKGEYTIAIEAIDAAALAGRVNATSKR